MSKTIKRKRANKMTKTIAECQFCGIEGEGADSWGGYCHDCDNYLEAVQHEKEM